MSATISHPSIAGAAAARTLRFGAPAPAGSGRHDDTVQWLLKRNCSASPRQMLVCVAALSLLSLAIGTFFWVQGASLVMPFAWLEVAALGVALLVYSRHAADSERIQLQPGRLTVEHVHGRHVDRVEFATAWVRIEPAHGDRSLIELSGQGQRISVGRFVRPELRRQLADELRWALRRWPWAPPRAGMADAPDAPRPTDTHDKSEN